MIDCKTTNNMGVKRDHFLITPTNRAESGIPKKKERKKKRKHAITENKKKRIGKI